jgi:DNA-binding transcriptional LysR family regulator
MNFRQLQVFQAVAETGGITSGSERLHISQPAVSKHIHDLEEELGTTLFDRHPRGVSLTASGEVLLRHARRLHALEEDARDELASLRGVRSGRLAIGASTTIGSYVLPSVLERFHQAHPGIRISLVVANTRHIQQQLTDFALDIGLTEGFVEPEAFHAEVFASDQLVPVASPAFARKHEISDLVTLASAPCIMRESGSGTRAVIERAFSRNAMQPRTLMSLGSTEAIKRMAASGVGYAVISRLAVAEELADGRLVKLPVPELTIERPLHLIRLQGHSIAPAVAAFTGLLESELADRSIEGA